MKINIITNYANSLQCVKVQDFREVTNTADWEL